METWLQTNSDSFFEPTAQPAEVLEQKIAHDTAIWQRTEGAEKQLRIRPENDLNQNKIAIDDLEGTVFVGD